MNHLQKIDEYELPDKDKYIWTTWKRSIGRTSRRLTDLNNLKKIDIELPENDRYELFEKDWYLLPEKDIMYELFQEDRYELPEKDIYIGITWKR